MGKRRGFVVRRKKIGLVSRTPRISARVCRSISGDAVLFHIRPAFRSTTIKGISGGILPDDFCYMLQRYD